MVNKTPRYLRRNGGQGEKRNNFDTYPSACLLVGIIMCKVAVRIHACLCVW